MVPDNSPAAPIGLYSLAERAQHSCKARLTLGTLLSPPGSVHLASHFPAVPASDAVAPISISQSQYSMFPTDEYIQRCLEDLMSNERAISSLQLRASPTSRGPMQEHEDEGLIVALTQSAFRFVVNCPFLHVIGGNDIGPRRQQSGNDVSFKPFTYSILVAQDDLC